MATFRYTALDADGSTLKGSFEAQDEESARRQIESSVYYLLSLQPVSPLVESLNRLLSRSVKRSTLVEFGRNLAVMIRAGIPISAALSDLVESADDPAFRAVIDKVRRDIALGSTFADAIGSHPHVFPTMYIRLVSIGEESGNLDGSLNDVADHLQRVEDLTSAIKNAMIYPIFALVTTMGAMIFWLVYVLPGILTMFKEMKIPIPPVTRFLMWASSFTLTWWPLLVTLPIVTFIGLKVARRWPRAAWRIDLVKLKLPIVQLILINKILALFAEQMRVLLRSGLTIDRSFNLAAEVIDNRVYHEAILQVREEVVTGSAISESLQRQKLFTPMFLRMVHIGETSGSLDDQFAFLAEYYVKRLDEVSQRLGKIIEPVIIIFVGIIFAVIIVGLLLPVYDMISTVGKG